MTNLQYDAANRLSIGDIWIFGYNHKMSLIYTMINQLVLQSSFSVFTVSDFDYYFKRFKKKVD